MNIARTDKSLERLILEGMVESEMVLNAVNRVWPGAGFSAPFANTVANWCIDFFKKYHVCPDQSAIVAIAAKWAETAPPDEEIKLVDAFLNNLFGDPNRKRLPEQFLIDMAVEMLNKSSVRKTMEESKLLMDAGRWEDAHAIMAARKKIELSPVTYYDVFNNPDVLDIAFSGNPKPIVDYPGVLGDFFGSALVQGGFVGIVAPQKTGKTAWLLDIAWQATVKQKDKRRVLYFEAGDSGKRDSFRRIACRAAKKPKYATKPGRPVRVARGIQPGGAVSGFTNTDYPQGCTQQEAEAAFQHVIQHRIRTNDSLLRMQFYPNRTLTVQTIESTIKQMEEQDRWVPDIVIIDYADLMASPGRFKDDKEKVDVIWSQLRRVSQTNNEPLVVTATQTNRIGDVAPSLKREHISQSNDKLSHVTAMFGIKWSETHRKDQVQDINCLAARELPWTEDDTIHAVGCLALGLPWTHTTW